MSTCPTCNEPTYEANGMVFHESSDMELCHVAQEAEQERITAYLEELHAPVEEPVE